MRDTLLFRWEGYRASRDSQRRMHKRRTQNNYADLICEARGILVLCALTVSPIVSVYCQVHRLITEATSQENLCQMYIGWMPWM